MSEYTSAKHYYSEKLRAFRANIKAERIAELEAELSVLQAERDSLQAERDWLIESFGVPVAMEALTPTDSGEKK